MFDANDFLKELNAQEQSFDPDAFLRQTEENPSSINSAIRGAAQSATLGFADEMIGAGESLIDKLRGSPQAIMALYRQHRDESRRKFEAAREGNPKSYFAGELLGAVPSAFIPGSGLAKAGSIGAVMGLGLSNSDISQGELGKAAIDTTLGFAAGAGTHKLTEILAPKLNSALESGQKLVGSGMKKAISSALGPSVEAIEARLAGRAQDNILSYPELAEEMKSSLNVLQKQINNESEAAISHLNPHSELKFGGVDKEVIKRELSDLRNKLRVNGNLVGNADHLADRALEDIILDIDQFGDGISQSDIKRIVQKLDQNINWEKSDASSTNKVLSQARNSLDTILKDNFKYQDSMESVADKTALSTELKRLFSFRNEPGEGLITTDATASKIKTALNENKAVTQKNLGALNNYTGKDFVKAAKDYDLSREFKGGYANGSRRVNLGAILGAGLGHVAGPPGALIGAAAGGMLGANLDREGGVYAGKLVDWYVHKNPAKLIETLGKHAQPLLEAAKRGPGALNATSYVLQQTSPEYRSKLMLLSEQN